MTEGRRDWDGGQRERARAMILPLPFDTEPERDGSEGQDVPAFASRDRAEPAVEAAEVIAAQSPPQDVYEVVPALSAPFDDLSELPSLIESLLFVTDHPVEESYLARALDVSSTRIERTLDELAATLREGGRGIRLQRGPEGVQLVTAPEAAARIEHFLGLEASRRLSTAALETLAIIAYRQPITRGQIDSIRGVSSDAAVATLRARELIAPAGYAPGPGRPMLFQTTQRFLEHFGLERAAQLPPLPEEIHLPPGEISEQLGLQERDVMDALAALARETAVPDGMVVAEDAGEPDGAIRDDVRREPEAGVIALSEAVEASLACAAEAPASAAPQDADA